MAWVAVRFLQGGMMHACKQSSLESTDRPNIFLAPYGEKKYLAYFISAGRKESITEFVTNFKASYNFIEFAGSGSKKAAGSIPETPPSQERTQQYKKEHPESLTLSQATLKKVECPFCQNYISSDMFYELTHQCHANNRLVHDPISPVPSSTSAPDQRSESTDEEELEAWHLAYTQDGEYTPYIPNRKRRYARRRRQSERVFWGASLKEDLKMEFKEEIEIGILPGKKKLSEVLYRLTGKYPVLLDVSPMKMKLAIHNIIKKQNKQNSSYW